MTPRFLRDEAERFRGMAEGSDREATRLRLLAMAADYESRAKAADVLIGETLDQAGEAPIEPEADEPDKLMTEPGPDEPTKLRISRRVVKPAKETVVVERHSVSRQR